MRVSLVFRKYGPRETNFDRNIRLTEFELRTSRQWGAFHNHNTATVVSATTTVLNFQVGVRIAEMRHFTGWEIFCHRLPKLTKLTIVFIGDECPTGKFPKDFTYKSKDVQQVPTDYFEQLW